MEGNMSTVMQSNDPAIRRYADPLTNHPVDAKREPVVLSELIHSKVADGLTWQSASEETPAIKPHNAFINFCFRRPWEDGRKRARRFGRGATLLNLVGVAAGLASSSLATLGGAQEGFSEQNIVVVLLGLTVSLAAATNQIARFGERSVARYQQVNALRREGWDFINCRGHYSTSASPDQRWDTFVDEVGRVQKAVEAVDEVRIQQPQP
jgi:hypothetical protein